MADIIIPHNFRSWSRGIMACAMTGMLCAVMQACGDSTLSGDLKPDGTSTDSLTVDPPHPPYSGSGGIDVWFGDWDGQEDHDMPL